MQSERNSIHRWMTRSISLAALCVLCAAGIAAQAGTAREVFKGSAKLRDETAKTAARIDDYSAQLVRTERDLARISKADRDLRGHYKSFSGNLAKLEKEQARAAGQIEKMRAMGTGYFTSWDKANILIADPELREASASRRSRVLRKYQSVAARISELGLSLPPMMSHLRDLNMFLAADLTPEAVGRASEMIRLSRSEAQDLRSEIADVQKMINELLTEAPR